MDLGIDCSMGNIACFNKRAKYTISSGQHSNISYLNILTFCSVDRALDSRSEGLGFDSQYWPCVEVLDRLHIPHCLGPPSRNGYVVHISKVGSMLAGCTGAHLARGKVKSVEHALSWSLDSKQLPLPLPLPYCVKASDYYSSPVRCAFSSVSSHTNEL